MKWYEGTIPFYQARREVITQKWNNRRKRRATNEGLQTQDKQGEKGGGCPPPHTDGGKTNGQHDRKTNGHSSSKDVSV